VSSAQKLLCKLKPSISDSLKDIILVDTGPNITVPNMGFGTILDHFLSVYVCDVLGCEVHALVEKGVTDQI
jgi:hypothetical protein